MAASYRKEVFLLGSVFKNNIDVFAISAIKANPPKDGDAKLQGLKWQPATEKGFIFIPFLPFKRKELF
jgi:hypothetical protein